MLKIVKIAIIAVIALLTIYVLFFSWALKENAKKLMKTGHPLPQASLNCKNWYRYAELPLDFARFTFAGWLKPNSNGFFRFGYSETNLIAINSTGNLGLMEGSIIYTSATFHSLITNSRISLYNRKIDNKKTKLTPVPVMEFLMSGADTLEHPDVDIWQAKGQTILKLSPRMAADKSFRAKIETFCQEIYMNYARWLAFQEASNQTCPRPYFLPNISLQPLQKMCQSIPWPMTL